MKGQTLRLRGPLPATRIIRSEHVYVVPRASGETVIGATVEDAGYDETPTDAATELAARGRRSAPFPPLRSSSSWRRWRACGRERRTTAR